MKKYIYIYIYIYVCICIIQLIGPFSERNHAEPMPPSGLGGLLDVQKHLGEPGSKVQSRHLGVVAPEDDVLSFRLKVYRFRLSHSHQAGKAPHNPVTRGSPS